MEATLEQQATPPLAPVLDLIVFAFCGYVAYVAKFNDAEMPLRYQAFIFCFAGVNLIISLVLGIYNSWRGISLTPLLTRYSLAVAVSAAITIGWLVGTKTTLNFSRLWIGYFFFLCLLVGSCFRSLFFYTKMALRARGVNLSSVLVVANGNPIPPDFGRQIQPWGFKLAEIFRIDPNSNVNEADLESALERLNPKEVWFCLPLSKGKLIEDAMYKLRHHTITIRYFPDFQGVRLLNHKASFIANRYALDLSCTPFSGVNKHIKRAEDLVLSLIICALIAPICLIIAAVVKFNSPGPVLFKQNRYGLDGNKFRVYKFRSMEVHMEPNGCVTQASKNDPRITKVGKFLRRTSLDELPQFFNVLTGDMSIVGPRPHALEHNEYYKDLVESYMQRHKVKPGITGWAQVNGLRGETDTVEKMKRRVEHDLWYIDNWSLLLDLKIIVRTAITGFRQPTAY